MKVLFTGATSKLGQLILKNLLSLDIVEECWCVIHKRTLSLEHPKLRTIPFDLEAKEGKISSPSSIDLLIHFAGLSYAFDENRYWDTNYHGTLRLVEQVREKGCRKMVYISSMRAATGAGAYGESKLAAEEKLLQMEWESLTILRPAEVYGLDGNEGIDRLIRNARKFRWVPMLFGNRKISFAPIHYLDFSKHAIRWVTSLSPGKKIILLRGPEFLNGIQLSLLLVKKYGALPLPVWWPLLCAFVQISNFFRILLVCPDQLARITAVDPSFENGLARISEEGKEILVEKEGARFLT